MDLGFAEKSVICLELPQSCVVLSQRGLLMMQTLPTALIFTGWLRARTCELLIQMDFNEGSESKNEGNSLAQPWLPCCFVRPGGYCRVLLLGTKALRDHL